MNRSTGIYHQMILTIYLKNTTAMDGESKTNYGDGTGKYERNDRKQSIALETKTQVLVDGDIIDFYQSFECGMERLPRNKNHNSETREKHLNDKIGVHGLTKRVEKGASDDHNITTGSFVIQCPVWKTWPRTNLTHTYSLFLKYKGKVLWSHGDYMPYENLINCYAKKDFKINQVVITKDTPQHNHYTIQWWKPYTTDNYFRRNIFVYIPSKGHLLSSRAECKINTPFYKCHTKIPFAKLPCRTVQICVEIQYGWRKHITTKSCKVFKPDETVPCKHINEIQEPAKQQRQGSDNEQHEREKTVIIVGIGTSLFLFFVAGSLVCVCKYKRNPCCFFQNCETVKKIIISPSQIKIPTCQKFDTHDIVNNHNDCIMPSVVYYEVKDTTFGPNGSYDMTYFTETSLSMTTSTASFPIYEEIPHNLTSFDQ